jgi:hypothetical protein
MTPLTTMEHELIPKRDNLAFAIFFCTWLHVNTCVVSIEVFSLVLESSTLSRIKMVAKAKVVKKASPKKAAPVKKVVAKKVAPAKVCKSISRDPTNHYRRPP